MDARRLGSPLDSFIEVLDADGRPVPRAVLRCLAKTHVTFRDHDSVQPNIRIEAWNELAVNDYLYVGSELLRIKALPPHPDADCAFFSVAGKRVGFLDTTKANKNPADARNWAGGGRRSIRGHPPSAPRSGPHATRAARAGGRTRGSTRRRSRARR